MVNKAMASSVEICVASTYERSIEQCVQLFIFFRCHTPQVCQTGQYGNVDSLFLPMQILSVDWTVRLSTAQGKY